MRVHIKKSTSVSSKKKKKKKIRCTHLDQIIPFKIEEV